MKNKNDNNKESNDKMFDETAQIVINENESGTNNNNNNNNAQTQNNSNIFSRIQNYLLGLTDRLQIQSNMKIFLVCLLLCMVNFFLCFISFPFIFFSPSRTLSYLSIGNVLLIISFLFYYGSSRFFGFLREDRRFKITLIHILFIFLGLFLPMFRGYILSFILDMALIITTILFILTIIPGGQGGINAIQGTLFSLLLGIINKFKK